MVRKAPRRVRIRNPLSGKHRAPQEAFPVGSGGAEPVGVAAGGDDVGAEGESVDDRGGQSRVGEGGAPFGERSVGGARNGCAFLPGGDDLEKQFRASGIEVDVANLVQLCGYPHSWTYADTATMPRRPPVTLPS